LIREDGKLERLQCSQKKLSEHLGGPLVFVGAMDDVSAVIVGRRIPDDSHATHSWSGIWPVSEPFVRGPIVIAGTDAEGGEMDLDIDLLIGALPRCIVQAL
jgi:hypothetical protein